MKTPNAIHSRRTAAFTLMELLVVISVIAILAALIVPAGLAMKNKSTIKKAQAEVNQISELIERYKVRFGYYPPDHTVANGVDALYNSLYFELVGSTYNRTNNTYISLDGSAMVTPADCQVVFGVGTILNSSKPDSEESKPAEKFLVQLKPNQYYEYTTGGSTIRLLTSSVSWPEKSGTVLPGVPFVNPFRYIKNGVTNNPGSYELWVDIVVGGKTNRVGNWSSTPQYVWY